LDVCDINQNNWFFFKYFC